MQRSRCRAVTIADAAGAMHRGSSTRGPCIATFYCKIFLLKTRVNLLLSNAKLLCILYINLLNAVLSFLLCFLVLQAFKILNKMLFVRLMLTDIAMPNVSSVFRKGSIMPWLFLREN